MHKVVTTITANTTVSTFAENLGSKGVIQTGGTFSGGTLTLFTSFDKGETINAMKDDSGTAYSATAADTFVYDFGDIKDNTNNGIRLYYGLASASTPSISITIRDNV
jgi:hypothetical protein